MQNSMWMNLKSPSFTNQPKQIVMYILDSMQSRKSIIVLAIFNKKQQSVKDYGHCMLRIWTCMIFICGETWSKCMNFGSYIDLNLDCLEITECQQCAIIHWAPGSWRWDHHTLFKHHTPNAQHGTTFQRNRTRTCHGICYNCEKCALLLEDTFSSHSSMR
jgi:hypothetical protein